MVLRRLHPTEATGAPHTVRCLLRMATMSSLTVGSLCSGYGGLDSAVGGTVAYVCDPEPAAAHVLAARHPDVPNLHDLKSLAWADIPVDVLAVGYPCQPFSDAGKRAGTEDPRHLWPWIAQGIARSRPPSVLLENVRGHLSLGWDTVLSDLHDLGYDVRWTLLRAADVGAAHNRARLFAVAADRAAHRWAAATGWPVARVVDGALNVPHDGLFGAHPLPLAENGHVPMWPAGLMIGGVVWEQDALLGTAQYEMLSTPRATQGGSATETTYLLAGHSRDGGHESTEVLLLRTPTAQLAVNGGSQHPDKRKDGGHGPTLADEVEHLLPTRGPNQRGSSGDLMLPSAVMPANLLPTPAVNDMGKAYTPDEWDAWCDKQRAAHGNGNGHGPSLEIEAARMAVGARWGRYAAAVARCEALTRPAPGPTLPSGKGGAHKLSPLFVEWLMMLPAGWVTDPALWTHLSAGAARNVQLKLLGNGVVPAQATAAWRHLTAGLRVAQVAA